MPQKILITRLSALGDIIHNLPALEVLKQTFPNAEIGWAVGAGGKALLQNHPLIDHLHVIPKLSLGSLIAYTKAINEIKQQQYDVVLDFQGLLKSALVGALAGIPRRYGYGDAREQAWRLYTHHSWGTPLKNHTTPVWVKYQELLATLNCQSVSPATYLLPNVVPGNTTQQTLAEFDLNRPIVALSCHTAWASKNWPMGHWAKLCQLVLEHTNTQIALLDDANPWHQLELLNIQKHCHSQNIKPVQLSIQQLMAFLPHTQAVICCDSFILHLAGALGLETIGLYGPTSALRTPPPGKSTLLSLFPTLECQPCHKKTCAVKTQACLVQLSPEQVFEALQAKLPALTSI